MKGNRALLVGIVVVALFALAVGWYLGSRGQRERMPVKLTTGFLFTGGSAAALMLADEKGYFADAGVRVDIVRGFGSNDAVIKIGAGTYEAGTGYFPELVRVKAEQPKLDAIAILIAYDGVPDTIVGLKSSGIRTPKDLEGRKIGAQTGGTPIRLFPLFAEKAGLDPKKVEFVTIPPELFAVMVQQGKVDMMAAFGSTLVTRFAQLGMAETDLVQFKYKDYLSLHGNALIVRKSWAAKNPEAARGLVKAYIRGLLYARDHPEEAVDVLVKREPLLDKKIELTDLLISNKDYYFTENVLKRGLGYHTAEDLARFIKTLAQPFELKREPAVDEVYDPQYLPPAGERAVKAS